MVNKYRIIEPKTINPPIALREVREGLIVAHPAFGRNTYNGNVQAMQGKFAHPQTREIITFREPKTQESIEASAHHFKELAKPEIFNPSWLQAGLRVGTKQGIFFNIRELNEEKLNYFLGEAQEHNRVYLLKDGISYVEHRNIIQGDQAVEDFARSPLARALEHTDKEVAPNLANIASHYPKVRVRKFNESEEPTSRVVGLYSGDDRLSVNGDWYGNGGGYAFGVLDTLGEGTKNFPKSF